MLACLEQTASLGPTVEVWSPRTGSRWGFSSSLDITRFSCSYFSFQCGNFRYRAKSARLPGCQLPNPLAVLPGVFNGICVGLGVKQRQPRLLPGSLALQMGPWCCVHAFWAGILLAAKRGRLHQSFLFNGATPSSLGCYPNRPIALA